MKGWLAAGGGLALVLGIFLAFQGFDRAVGWAGVFSAFAGLAAVIVGALPLLKGGQSMKDVTAGRDINQVGKVRNFSTGKGAPRKGASAGRDVNRVEEAGDFRTGDDR